MNEPEHGAFARRKGCDRFAHDSRPLTGQRGQLGLVTGGMSLDRVADLQSLGIVAGPGRGVERAQVGSLQLPELLALIRERKVQKIGQLGLRGRAAVSDEEVLTRFVELATEMAY